MLAQQDKREQEEKRKREMARSASVATVSGLGGPTASGGGDEAEFGDDVPLPDEDDMMVRAGCLLAGGRAVKLVLTNFVDLHHISLVCWRRAAFSSLCVIAYRIMPASCCGRNADLSSGACPMDADAPANVVHCCDRRRRRLATTLTTAWCRTWRRAASRAARAAARPARRPPRPALAPAPGRSAASPSRP